MVSTHVPYLAIGEVRTFILAAGKGAIHSGCWEGWDVRVGLGGRTFGLRRNVEDVRKLSFYSRSRSVQGLWQPPI